MYQSHLKQLRLFIKCSVVLCCFILADFFKDQSSSHKIWILSVSGALIIIIIITIWKKKCKSHIYFPFVGWITQKLLNSTKLGQRMGHSPEKTPLTVATNLDKGTDPGFCFLTSFNIDRWGIFSASLFTSSSGNNAWIVMCKIRRMELLWALFLALCSALYILHILVKLFTVMENMFTNSWMKLSCIYRRSFSY